MARLTERAHAAVAESLHAGDTAVDATAGNGHDTEFLSRRVGVDGMVFAFDIQPQALQMTSDRVQRRGLNNVILFEANHADLLSRLPVEVHERVATVMFNLGYLPGGNKQLVTRPETTVRAIQDARRVLRPGGLLSIIAYPGHPGGALELKAVNQFCDQLPEQSVHRHRCAPDTDDRGTAPCLFLVKKEE